ncbi:MAG: hypothetical protein AMJ92_12050 [candidate division Zixibacteria bacterium SM23_81]|nr:MAG: hypothetical protein AMJ92_12050 [candidate division Zixibacteria bacterium SM23_81]
MNHKRASSFDTNINNDWRQTDLEDREQLIRFDIGKQNGCKYGDAKILLDEKDLPQRRYNIQADLPKPFAPPLHPGTGQSIGPQDQAPPFPRELIK